MKKKIKKAQYGVQSPIKKVTGDSAYDSLLSQKNDYLMHNNQSQKMWEEYLRQGIQGIKTKRGKEVDKKAGVINDNNGYLNPKNKGKVVKIDSNVITMQGVDQPLLGISDTNDIQLMHPNQDYTFKGNNVTEFPVAKDGKWIQKAINPKHKGYCTPMTKSTCTPHRKALAKTFKKHHGFHKAQDGFSMNDIPQENATQIDMMPYQSQGTYDMYTGAQYQPIASSKKSSNFYNNIGGMYGVSQGLSTMNNTSQGQNSPSQSQQLVSQFGPWGQAISSVSQIGTSYTKNDSGLGANALESFALDPAGSTWLNKDLSTKDRVLGGLFQGYGAQKNSEAEKAKVSQKRQLKKLVNKASTLPEENNRRYVRPEDRLSDPNELFPTYGVGTNYLAKNGKNIPAYAMGGDIKTHWGGEAETSSVNPYLPYDGETVEFKGDSHKEGGIGVTFGKSPVEVEGGEPALKLQDGGNSENLVVFGNMTIPGYGATMIGDKEAKGKKFKNYIKDLNNKENKQNKILDRSSKDLDMTVKNAFDKLKFSSAEAMSLGANMNLKSIANKKQSAAGVQNALLETAEEMNLDSEALSKGNIKKAKKGAYIKAQDGQTVSSYLSDIEKFKKAGYREDPNLNNLFTLNGQGNLPPAKTPDKLGDEDKYWNDFLIPKLSTGTSPEELANKGYIAKGAIPKASKYYVPNTGGKEAYVPYPDMSGGRDLSAGDITMPKMVGSPFPVKSAPPSNPSAARGKFPFTDVFNTVLPYIRPSNKTNLNVNQIAGELNALATNQLEPVQAQKYQPLLEQPYDISLQDQLNANQSDFNAIQRLTGNNPSAQGVLAGQKYAANSGVLAEQFRLNQNQKAGVYARNRATLNDSQLKNLGILDQQYVRQSQAKSNTKAVTQAAISSIASKIQQHKLENRTLGIYENLYNYRYNNKGVAVNMNPLVNFDAMIQQATQNGLVQVDNDGKIVINERRVTKDKNQIPKEFRDTTRTIEKKNGGLVKAMKGSHLKSYC